MAARLPNGFIDELMSRIDIVEVIDKRVPLRKAGREHSACCPFHAEKTPSFTVSPQKQFYHCFGCGAHGTAIGFLMEYERLPFLDAVAELAALAGIAIPKTEKSALGFSGDYAILTEVAAYYRSQLQPSGEKVQAYLSQRGLNSASLELFELGYAPAQWSSLANRFKAQTQRDSLLKLGLVLRANKGGYYDRFRARVIFPIADQRGRVVGFGGRALGDDKPKYLNSPESTLFHKGRELFNLHRARRHANPQPLLVVEGYMDVVMLVQHGIENVVATLGTAVTTTQLQRLFTVTPQLVFCFDGDAAGQKAAWRMLNSAFALLEKGREIAIVKLPTGADPDSFVRKSGKAGFAAQIEAATPLADYFFRHLLSQIKELNEGGRAKLVELAQPYVSKIPDTVFRRLMLDRLAKYAMVDREVLENTRTGPAKQAPGAGLGLHSVKLVSPLRAALTLLLQQPNLAREVDQVEELLDLHEEGIKLLVEVVDYFKQNPHLNCAGLMEQWRHRVEAKILAQLAKTPILVPEASGLDADFKLALMRLRNALRQQRIEELLGKSRLQPLDVQEQGRLQRLFKEQSVAKQPGVV